jgi:glycosyltransferase involved in cell wall biosynthesis
LSKFGKYNVTIPIWSNRDYPTWKAYFPNAEFPVIEWTNSEKDQRHRLALWIYRNAKEIDILHTYFWDRGTWLYITAYRKANPNGVIYVHLDSNGEQWTQYAWPRNPLKKFVMKSILSKKCLDNVLFGLQNRENTQKLSGKWPFTNLMYVPNGFTWPEDLPYTPFQNRNNVILTVARNGTPPKRTDILMNGFANVAQEFPEWKLVLAGTVEESFKPFINSYFVKHPELKDRVNFIGSISDRSELQRLYASSKIFALPSAWEGFGLVTVEAMSQGCYVVESDIPANKDITCNGKYGSLHKCLDENDFTRKLREALCDQDNMKSVSEAAYDYVNRNYHWETVLKPVYDWIQMKLEGKEELTPKAAIMK